MTMVPTDEERTKLQEAQMQFPETPFAHAESFLITLSSISELSARLNLWMFKVDYDNLENVFKHLLMFCLFVRCFGGGNKSIYEKHF